MEYCEFIKPFYNAAPSKSGLRGMTSQSAVAKFFMEASFEDMVPDEFIYSDDTYRKWLTGPNKPKQKYWKEIEKVFNTEKYRDIVSVRINENVLNDLIEAFGIRLEAGVDPNKKIFAEALAVQFFEIVKGRGEANDEIETAYKSRMVPISFQKYIRKAVGQYNQMSLLGREECPLEECYVCNHIGTRPSVFANRRNGIIEEATLEKIRTFDRRGDNKNTILIGSGGMGKTLMLQHLFVEAASHYGEKGVLPIIVELREFSYNHDSLRDSIIETVQNFDETFSTEEADRMLTDGKCQILLDGVDEIDPYDIKDFQRNLASFMKKYPDNQIVMTSRDCDAFSGIKGFVKLYLLPFDKEQSLCLIDRLLMNVRDEDAKKKVLDYIEKTSVKKDGAFVSNPMLLTFIVERYPKLDKFYGNRLLFYKAAYNEIVIHHDNYKTAYERIFRSASDPEEFTKIFREFCGETYRQGIFEFDTATFEKHFKEIKTITELENPGKMKVKNFLHDACTTACMMYEQDTDILYMDPGFQEYFFAEYYSYENSERVKEMGRTLWNTGTQVFKRWGAFKMLYDFSPEKTEVCLFIPYLDSIFKGKTDDEAFVQFLAVGYSKLRYTVLDKKKIEKYGNENGVMSQMNLATLNEPKSVILSMIYKLLKEWPHLRIVTEDSNVAIKDLAMVALTGEMVISHMGENPCEKLLLRGNPQSEFDDMDSFEENHSVSRCIRDEDGHIVCFGNEYEINTHCFEIDSSQYLNLLHIMRSDSEINRVYEHIKGYYTLIIEKQKNNEYR